MSFTVFSISSRFTTSTGECIYLTAGDKNPSMPFILKIAIKGDKDGFIVEFPQLKNEFNIDPDKPKNFKPLNHLIFSAIKDRFENELEKFLKHRSVEHYPEYM